MEKRLIIAIALSLIILLSWSALVSKTQHFGNKEVTVQAPVIVAPAPPKSTPSVSEQISEIPIPTLDYMHENEGLSFIEPLAAIQEITFKTYQNYKFPLKYGLLLVGQDLKFIKTKSSSQELTFEHTDKTKKIVKRFIFDNSIYALKLEILVQNLSSAPITLDLPLILAVLDFSSNSIQSRYQDVIASTQEKTFYSNGRKDQAFSNVKFLSVRDRYFCAIIEPESSGFSGFVHKLTGRESEIGLSINNRALEPGQQIGHKFNIYFGPQDLQIINAINPAWSAIIHYGTFDVIAQFILFLLRFFYGIVHNWGWSIVILSLVVYLILYPLSLKQMRSMKEMQALQPKIEELRKLYKDNPQRLNKEIMELYRLHKVNPFGGCLPLLLQMPIFFALYQALMRSVVLKGAHFLWIKDLSEPDRLLILPFSIPILGNEVNILPLVMTIGMFIQQKISMVATTSSSAEQQKMMMILFPLLFGVIFYHMPSGLVLYWFINSTLMLAYQWRIRHSR